MPTAILDDVTVAWPSPPMPTYEPTPTAKNRMIGSHTASILPADLMRAQQARAKRDTQAKELIWLLHDYAWFVMQRLATFRGWLSVGYVSVADVGADEEKARIVAKYWFEKYQDKIHDQAKLDFFVSTTRSGLSEKTAGKKPSEVELESVIASLEAHLCAGTQYIERANQLIKSGLFANTKTLARALRAVLDMMKDEEAVLENRKQLSKRFDVDMA